MDKLNYLEYLEAQYKRDFSGEYTAIHVNPEEESFSNFRPAVFIFNLTAEEPREEKEKLNAAKKIITDFGLKRKYNFNLLKFNPFRKMYFGDNTEVTIESKVNYATKPSGTGGVIPDTHYAIRIRVVALRLNRTFTDLTDKLNKWHTIEADIWYEKKQELLKGKELEFKQLEYLCNTNSN